MSILLKNLSLKEILPLTCTRKGTCCHGNQVLLNPWELHILAKTKNLTPKELRDNYTDFGGIRLLFNGTINEYKKSACNFYDQNKGCNVHVGRPLACRLFPLGRKIQNNEVNYIQLGEQFPCIKECSQVLDLPSMSVENYLQEQQTKLHETAQDYYLEVMQNLADIGFMLLLETPLRNANKYNSIKTWKKLGKLTGEELKNIIGSEWIDLITIPNLKIENDSPLEYITAHNELLQFSAQEKLNTITQLKDIDNTCNKIIASALFIAKSIGSNIELIAEHWVEIAIQHGAVES